MAFKSLPVGDGSFSFGHNHSSNPQTHLIFAPIEGNQTMLTIHEISEKFVSTYGFDPNYVYCSRTGKPIAFMFAEEIDSIVSTLGDDPEAAIDDLALRIIASSRPSIKWNKLRETDLNDMRKSHPVETMAYLLNRLFDSKVENWFSAQRGRIWLFSKLHEFHIMASPIPNQSYWDMCLMMLLELEAKLGLTTETASFDVDDLDVETPELMATLHSLLRPFHKRRVDFHRQAEADAKFFAANPGAKRAYFASWMESSPPSEATIAKAVKQQDSNLFKAILDELLGSGETKPASHRPTQEQMTKPETKPASKVLVKSGFVFGGLKS